MRVVVFSLFSALAVSSCAVRPLADDVQIGQRVAAAMEAEVGRYEDDDVQSYVAGIAERVVAQVPDSPFSYRFAVLDQLEPNAFAAPGGWVFVSRGLLAIAQREDELAGVLGHELTHVEHRHSAQASRPRVLGSILSLPGNVLGVVLPRVGALANAPIDTVQALQMASYGRGQESESDRVGQELAAAAGYDPAALGGILARMDRVVAELTGERQRSTYFDTHPPTPSRIGDIRAHADELQASPRPAGALDDESFLRWLDGLVWGPNPARGVFREQRYLAPLLGVGIDFPKGWTTMSTATLVGAAREDGRAAVFFSLVATSADGLRTRIADTKAKMAADGFEERSDEGLRIDGRQLRLAEFGLPDGGGDVVLQAWTRFGSVYGEFVAAGPAGERDRLLEVIRSLSSLGPAERASITVARLRIVAAEAGETVEALHARCGSSESPAMIAALNGLRPDSRLQRGRLIKIVREEAFP